MATQESSGQHRDAQGELNQTILYFLINDWRQTIKLHAKQFLRRKKCTSFAFDHIYNQIQFEFLHCFGNNKIKILMSANNSVNSANSTTYNQENDVCN